MSNETPDLPAGDNEHAQAAPHGAVGSASNRAATAPAEFASPRTDAEAPIPAPGVAASRFDDSIAPQSGERSSAPAGDALNLGKSAQQEYGSDARAFGSHPSEARTERLAQQAPTQRFERPIDQQHSQFGPPQGPAGQGQAPHPSSPQPAQPAAAPGRSGSPQGATPAALFAAPAGPASQSAPSSQPGISPQPAGRLGQQPGAPLVQQEAGQPGLGQQAPLHAGQSAGYPQRTPVAAHPAGQPAAASASRIDAPAARGAQPFAPPPAPGPHVTASTPHTYGQHPANDPANPALNAAPGQYAGNPQHDGWQQPQPPGPQPAKRKRERARTPWLTLVVVALVAALAASVGTGFIMRGDGTPAAVARTASPTATQLGTSSEDSVDVPVTSSSSENPNWQEVAAAVAPSVVSIQIQTNSGAGEGSGVIVDAEGLVLTNDHVVGDATKVSVTLQDGRIYSASIVGTDSTTDLAVVKLDGAPDDLKSAVFADSDAVKVGDAVMAVGNPLGLSNTATTGIVSALNRPVTTSGNASTQSETVVTNAIQIDAAINPGNSGGPLFNAQGEVIGITSSIATMSDSSSTSGSIGLGFAIPSNVANMIGGQLIENGVAEHAFLGVGLVDGQATADGVTRQGAQVQQVVSGSPAEKADIETGDVIVAIDGQAVSGAQSLTAFVRAEASGTKVTLTIVRDGKTLSTEVTLETRVDDATSQSGQGQDDQQDQQGQQQAPGQQLPQFPQLPGDSDDN
ncbi:hypothetical protein GCM10010401_04890 [Rarobacter faecitabidus]|uniref:Putative serine protease PepD n=1 Tax=Rarobacter faecitabidus TaxID=13243 RepID=A0A542ZU16_RARFA|nr:trypsin-like peptidase domain-containing protein [Rarobacter faecitabidus]TQL63756.1 putative serine protease PepD [Rarobacter faecitabidus]